MLGRSAATIKSSNLRPYRCLYSTSPSRAKTQRVKKQVAELPQSYTLPSGERATPLPAFQDASNAPRTLKAKKKGSSKPSKAKLSESSLPEGNATLGHRGGPQPHDDTSAEVMNQPRTQLAREILENLRRFPHCLLLTRVGQFYESYFEQANEIASLLNIKLTSRKWGGRRVPMCGFPLLHLDRHLKTLVQHHKRFVAMCEEFPIYGSFGETGFERRVTRIVTPGTLIDEPFLNTLENNYLLSIHLVPEKSAIGLAWIDVSTGEFFSKESTLETLQDELVRIGPREVILDSSLRDSTSHPVLTYLKEENIFFSFSSSQGEDESSQRSEPEAAAVSMLSAYLQKILMGNAPRLDNPYHETDSTKMQVDAHTIKSLEIREASYEGGTTGSPSISFAEIEGWQSTVAFFSKRTHLRADLIEHLKQVGDISRIVQRFTLKRGDVSDLLSVKKTIDLWGQIIKRLELEKDLEKRKRTKRDWEHIDLLRKRIRTLEILSNRIQSALADANDQESESVEEEEQKALVLQESTPLMENSVKWTIKPSFSRPISALHSSLHDLYTRKDDLECRLRTEYNAPSLTLRASPSQGMHIHIAKPRKDSKNIDTDSSFTTISESASTKSYFYREWSELGTTIARTTALLAQEEKQAFETLREEVVSNAVLLRSNSTTIDEIDVAIGFAVLAEELKFVRPTITEERLYHVVNGRHPSVEMGLMNSGRIFTPNTIEMTPSSNMHIITGPNMAGKSTVLRQTALIAVLAQVGSFVPADAATIGLIDKLFTRIGAKDDLFRDRSTFMVEMLETADILRRATSRSLVSLFPNKLILKDGFLTVD
ncbi:hypothetical protein EST38_g11599 [Candolleomyces aberdarensis]|uniref:DNA mismatch repair proteins mutS family domain-containing protein n=1 Tax=Candolleomyces aberdarensis TaxID=2316362 RepID=A0A4Q2D7R9_9AGAR|nr:hypothetical protein EST38_g11599 [Candolleomyces aberdarensis]